MKSCGCLSLSLSFPLRWWWCRCGVGASKGPTRSHQRHSHRSWMTTTKEQGQFHFLIAPVATFQTIVNVVVSYGEQAQRLGSLLMGLVLDRVGRNNKKVTLKPLTINIMEAKHRKRACSGSIYNSSSRTRLLGVMSWSGWRFSDLLFGKS